MRYQSILSEPLNSYTYEEVLLGKAVKPTLTVTMFKVRMLKNLAEVTYVMSHYV